MVIPKDKEWRPFEPCRENVERAQNTVVFMTFDFSGLEMKLHAEYLNNLKNPTLLPVKDKP